MSGLSVQAPRAVVLIRPHRFRPNPHTRDDNGFQAHDRRRTPEQGDEALVEGIDDMHAYIMRHQAMQTADKTGDFCKFLALCLTAGRPDTGCIT